MQVFCMYKYFFLDLYLDYIKEINKLFVLYVKEIIRDLVCQIKIRIGWILDLYEIYIWLKNKFMGLYNDMIKVKVFVFWYL